jgi:DNA-binding GntR family transcriptional regulator
MMSAALDMEAVVDLDALAVPSRVSDGAYQALQAAIVNGRLSPGTRLSVPALAAQLGVSRSPVREALTRLISDGLAVEVPHRGAVVANLAPADLLTVYELREVLEGLAARLAASRIESVGEARLRSALADHVAAADRDDRPAATAADVAFHTGLREIAGNAELEKTLGDIQARIRVAMRTTVVTEGPRPAIADHEKILDAVAAKDPKRAERCARAHIARLIGALRRQRGEDA